MGRAQPAFAPVRDGWEKFRKTDIEYRVYFIFINPQSIDLEASYIFIIFVYVYIYNNKIKLYNPNNYAMILHYYKENYINWKLIGIFWTGTSRVLFIYVLFIT